MEAFIGQIQITTPTGAVRTVPLPKGETIIGCQQGSGIFLDDPEVSPRHVQVHFDGTQAHVMDLESAAGTFLDDIQLLPGMLHEWAEDEVLRVGKTILRLVVLTETKPLPDPVGHEHDPVGQKPDPVGHKPDPVGHKPGPVKSQVAVWMDTLQFAVEPGKSVRFPVKVINQGDLVSQFQIHLEGVPAGWVKGAPSLVEMMPGDERVVQLEVAPPRVPESRAGRYPLIIQARSVQAPDQRAELRGSITVAAFHEFQAQLDPEQIRADQTGKLYIRNGGNVQENFQLVWKDRGDELVFTPPAAQLPLAEGQPGVVEYRASPRRRRLVGREKSHPFTVMTSLSPELSDTRTGELVSRALLPAWVPMILALLFGACLYLVWTLISQPPVIRSIEFEPQEPLAGQPVTVRWDIDRYQSIEFQPLNTRLGSRDNQFTFQNGFDGPTDITVVVSNRFRSIEQPLKIPVIAKFIAVPDVAGLTEADAKNRVAAAGLVVGTVTTQFSTSVDPGKIILTDPPIGKEIERGALVNLFVSQGACIFTVPDVAQLPEADARAQVESACQGEVCVEVQSAREASDTVAAGSVIRSDPAPGPVACGSDLTLVVSSGLNPEGDTDQDGMSNTFEEQFGLDPKVNDAEGDLDSDQLTNLGEFQRNTDPTQPDSDSDGMPDGFEVRFGLDPLSDDGGDDQDGDQLTNLKEFQIATDPTKPDTDGDGLPDNYEDRFGLNPNANDAGNDPDGDGLTNQKEFQLATNPTSADTDGDGMPDGYEDQFGLNPTANDAGGDLDNDGLANGQERERGTGPANPDSDEDGVQDGGDPLPLQKRISAQTVASLEKTDRLEDQCGNVSDVVYSLDGKLLGVLGESGCIRIYSTAEGELRPVSEINFDAAYSLDFSADGSLVAASSTDQGVRVFRVSDGSVVYEITNHTAIAKGVVFSPISNVLFTGSYDDTIIFWDMVSGRRTRTVEMDYQVSSLAISPDGTKLAVGGRQGELQILRASTGEVITTFAGAENLAENWSLDFSPDGKLLAAGTFAGTIELWPAGGGGRLRVLSSDGIVTGVDFSPDSSLLASATSFGGTLQIWQVSDGTALKTYNREGAISAAFAPDQHTLMTGSAEDALDSWSVK